ncbi:hypothetical protein [uncultured Hydrogenophaga sp.]|uniref:hypothetical protein n=1 Tax=uncultured Hydrogenophaga sp. TaxID=199683 RepID=UPI00265FA36B|nr:hypothetical protein [uncultured Hydrogenophaga sp.]
MNRLSHGIRACFRAPVITASPADNPHDMPDPSPVDSPALKWPDLKVMAGTALGTAAAVSMVWWVALRVLQDDAPATASGCDSTHHGWAAGNVSDTAHQLTQVTATVQDVLLGCVRQVLPNATLDSLGNATDLLLKEAQRHAAMGHDPVSMIHQAHLCPAHLLPDEDAGSLAGRTAHAIATLMAQAGCPSSGAASTLASALGGVAVTIGLSVATGL